MSETTRPAFVLRPEQEEIARYDGGLMLVSGRSTCTRSFRSVARALSSSDIPESLTSSVPG